MSNISFSRFSTICGIIEMSKFLFTYSISFLYSLTFKFVKSDIDGKVLGKYDEVEVNISSIIVSMALWITSFSNLWDKSKIYFMNIRIKDCLFDMRLDNSQWFNDCISLRFREFLNSNNTKILLIKITAGLELGIDFQIHYQQIQPKI